MSPIGYENTLHNDCSNEMKNKRYTYGVAQRVSPKGKRQNVYEKKSRVRRHIVYVAQRVCVCRPRLNVNMSPKA